MKIGIDAYETNISQRVGIGQYAYNLLKYLHRVDRKNEYTIFLPTPPREDLPAEKTGWNYVVGKQVSFWTMRELPLLIKKYPVELFFSTTHYLPWFTSIPKILSLMDLSYLHFPQMFRMRDLLQLKFMGLYSIKRAKKILAISEFTKREIIEHYKYPKEDIVVTYPGVSIKYQISQPKAGRPLDENIITAKAGSRQSYKSKEGGKNTNKILKRFKRYLLFVGTIQPRKNIVRLIQAFELMGDKELQLVLVGKKGWLYEPIFAAIRESPKRDKIIYLDFVSDSELVNLYQQAICLILPSLYEGFGIPVVEALSLDCPVVVSNTTSLPEVAGEAGIYVDPMQTEDIARGINKVLQLSQREREIIIKEGQEQIKKFSWEKCAQKTLEAFNTIL